MLHKTHTSSHTKLAKQDGELTKEERERIVKLIIESQDFKEQLASHAHALLGEAFIPTLQQMITQALHDPQLQTKVALENITLAHEYQKIHMPTNTLAYVTSNNNVAEISITFSTPHSTSSFVMLLNFNILAKLNWKNKFNWNVGIDAIYTTRRNYIIPLLGQHTIEGEPYPSDEQPLMNMTTNITPQISKSTLESITKEVLLVISTLPSNPIGKWMSQFINFTYQFIMQYDPQSPLRHAEFQENAEYYITLHKMDVVSPQPTSTRYPTKIYTSERVGWYHALHNVSRINTNIHLHLEFSISTNIYQAAKRSRTKAPVTNTTGDANVVMKINFDILHNPQGDPYKVEGAKLNMEVEGATSVGSGYIRTQKYSWDIPLGEPDDPLPPPDYDYVENKLLAVLKATLKMLLLTELAY